jgi:fructuronate reductase
MASTGTLTGVVRPVRLVHLGLGSFFRAHQAWYTEHSGGREEWGYAAFGGRSSELAAGLAAQGGHYTLITRAAESDRLEVVRSLSAVHGADDHEAWLRYLSSPHLAALTLTVTEAGYCLGQDGHLDFDRPDVAADVAALRAASRGPRPARSPGLGPHGAGSRGAGSRGAGSPWAGSPWAGSPWADAGPLAIVPCDNLSGNGALTLRAITELAQRVDPGLAAHIAESVSVVSTVVDRITPRPTAADTALVNAVPVNTRLVNAVPVKHRARRRPVPRGDRALPRLGAERGVPRRAPALGGRRRPVHRRSAAA